MPWSAEFDFNSTSGGTIPDRGLYGVFLAGAEGPGRRVGELDEEMVYESRVGDVFTLGTSSWRVEQITHDRVLVSPAPGQAARLPFWKGDTLGRPAELGTAVGGFVREIAGLPASAARERVRAAGLDEWAADNLLGYLDEQREAIGRLPHDRQIVVERFRDELGDWRVVVHSPFGARVHAPWSLVVAARLRERFGVDVQAMHADDGLVFRLPDTEWDVASADSAGTVPADSAREAQSASTGAAQANSAGADTGTGVPPGTGRRPTVSKPGPPDELLELIFPDPDEVAAQVREQVGGSALFASRFRECAGRALLLPKRRPDRRQALWLQRQRAAQLLEVASQYPSFPIVLEAVRECVNDVFDVPSLVALLRGVRAREITTVAVETARPSPFASSLMFGYVAQFLYEGDSPLAEKRAAALALDPTLLSELLGTTEGLSLADLLDPEALSRTETELQHLAEGRRARDAEELTDVLRVLGPMTLTEAARRCTEPDAAGGWLDTMEAARRVVRVRLAGAEHWIAIEDAGRLRDALGVSLPLGVPEAFLESTTDPLGDLLARFARSRAPFTAAEAAAWLGLGPVLVRDMLRRLVADGRLVEGDLRPVGWVPSAGAVVGAAEGGQFCDAKVLRLLRRRSLASLRSAVEPVGTTDFARFLPAWQGLGALRGTDGVLRTVEQLAGVPLPASALESLILPARVRDYRPAMLDELTAAGEVLWQGHGSLSGRDGWVSLHPADLAPLTLAEPREPAPSEVAEQLRTTLTEGGGFFFRALSDHLGLTDDTATVDALWELVWGGWITNDTLGPLRAHLGEGTTAHRPRPPTALRGRYGRGLGRAVMPRRTGPPQAAGRWSALPERDLDATARMLARAEVLLDRYGVVTRGSVSAEDVPGGFASIYRVLSAAEDAGRVRRGYFVEHLGAAQFATTGAIDRLRGFSRPLDGGEAGPALVLAACDPANPYGAAVAWPERPASGETRGHQPARKAGAVVVLVDGEPVLYVERGGRTLLSWSEDARLLAPAATALAEAVHDGVLGKLTVEKVDGEAVLGSVHPLARALSDAGFRLTPRGLRLRR